MPIIRFYAQQVLAIICTGNVQPTHDECIRMYAFVTTRLVCFFPTNLSTLVLTVSYLSQRQIDRAHQVAVAGHVQIAHEVYAAFHVHGNCPTFSIATPDVVVFHEGGAFFESQVSLRLINMPHTPYTLVLQYSSSNDMAHQEKPTHR